MNDTFEKNIYTRSILIIVILILYFDFSVTYATSTVDLQKKQSEVDKKISQTQEDILGIKDEMSIELTQISILNVQISECQTELDKLEYEINVLNNEIITKKDEIKEKEKELNERRNILRKRLVAIYEKGKTSYLDMLLSSENLSDFISKYYLISQLVDCDKELFNSIENAKIEIETEKNFLINKKNEVEQTQMAANRKKNTLNLMISEKESIIDKLSVEEKEKQNILEEFEQDKRDIQLELAKIARKNGNITPVSPNEAGYISPLKGKTKANITTSFDGYPNHGGVDYACNSGTPVLAVKAGEVVISTALKRANGSYKSYGEYIVIDHKDGTMTLYAHMLPNSRMVALGNWVSQGQQIGQVGSTGNSSGNHLHFEIRINGIRIDPIQYLP